MANEWRRYCAKITNVWILKKVSWNYWFISSLRCYDVPLQTQQSLYNLHSAQCTIVAPNHCYMINSGHLRATDATTKCNMLQSSKRCGCNKCICLNFNGKCKCPFVMYFFTVVVMFSTFGCDTSICSYSKSQFQYVYLEAFKPLWNWKWHNFRQLKPTTLSQMEVALQHTQEVSVKCMRRVDGSY